MTSGYLILIINSDAKSEWKADNTSTHIFSFSFKWDFPYQFGLMDIECIINCFAFPPHNNNANLYTWRATSHFSKRCERVSFVHCIGNFSINIDCLSLFLLLSFLPKVSTPSNLHTKRNLEYPQVTMTRTPSTEEKQLLYYLHGGLLLFLVPFIYNFCQIIFLSWEYLLLSAGYGRGTI